MKVEHDKVPLEQFTPGKLYKLSLGGTELYTAEVLKFHGGCWATVRVSEVLSASHSNDYKPGMSFEIKVAEYDLEVVG